jgi:hypothetical protein
MKYNMRALLALGTLLGLAVTASQLGRTTDMAVFSSAALIVFALATFVRHDTK